MKSNPDEVDINLVVDISVAAKEGTDVSSFDKAVLVFIDKV